MDERQFKAQARDQSGEWKVMLTGTPQQARSKVVAEAGFMAQQGWVVVVMNWRGVTVQHPDDPARQTEFVISEVEET